QRKILAELDPSDQDKTADVQRRIDMLQNQSEIQATEYDPHIAALKREDAWQQSILASLQPEVAENDPFILDLRQRIEWLKKRISLLERTRNSERERREAIEREAQQTAKRFM